MSLLDELHRQVDEIETGVQQLCDLADRVLPPPVQLTPSVQ